MSEHAELAVSREMYCRIIIIIIYIGVFSMQLVNKIPQNFICMSGAPTILTLGLKTFACEDEKHICYVQ